MSDAYWREDREYWETRFTMHYPDGTSQWVRRKPTRNTKRGAERFGRELREQLLNDWRAEREGLTLEDAPKLKHFRNDFIEWAEANVKQSTVTSYASILDIGLVPAMGELRLDEITERHIEKYKATKKVSAKTMKNHLGVLSRLFWLAKRYRLVRHPPEIDSPVPQKSKIEELEFWTFAEADRVLEHVDGEPRIANIVRLGLSTGLRMGELCGLQRGDVDLVAGTLMVRRQYTKGRVTTPKGNRKRRLPLSDAAIDALERQKPATFMRATPGEDWVFVDEQGLFSYNRIRDGYWRIVRDAEVTEISFHGLRHTFASHCVMRGVPLEVLQKWLGHADIRQTMRYAHLAEDHSDRFVELLNSPNRVRSSRQE